MEALSNGVGEPINRMQYSTLGMREQYEHDPPRNARVLCDGCRKWQRIQAALADQIEQIDCGWTCQDNTDRDFGDCSIPPKKSNSEINEELETSDGCREEAAYGTFLKLNQDRSKDAQQSSRSLIKSNLFLNRSRKTQAIDQIMVCHCKPPSDGRLGCGDTCLNRLLNVECVEELCPCGELCSNQQFQKHKYSKLKWFRCGKKGYGLQVLEDIPRGQFLIEYVGEVIDAWAKGNLGRFINHSSDPNCRTEMWMVNGEVSIGLFSLRDIMKGEEITFDYSFVCDVEIAAKKCECDFIGENLDSVEDCVVSVKEIDGEKVESLMSILQSSGIVHGSIEPHMDEMHLVLDNDLVLKVLQTPCVPGENMISFFRWVLKKSRFKLTSQVLNELVRMICMHNKRREVYALWDLINEVWQKKKGVVSSECLNEIIAEFSRLEKGNAAFAVFNKFEDLGCAANADTYYLTIEALCKRSFYDWAGSVCEKMLTADQLPDAGRVGKIISYLCKGGLAKDAHLVYLNAKNKKIGLPRSSINAVVSSLCRIEKTNEGTNKEHDRETVSLALELLNEYSAEDRKYAVKLFSSVIRKLCWIEDFDRATKLVLDMIESGPPPGNAVFNSVITGLTKSENTKEARSLMKVMESRGLRPDVYTYCVIISGLAGAGEMDEACKIFDAAKKKHSKLTPVAYLALIRGFCNLEQFDKAVNLVLEMRQHGVQPKHDEYNELIKSLCLKALDCETAEKLHEDMIANGIALNGRTKAFISAVRDLQEEGASVETSDSA